MFNFRKYKQGGYNKYSKNNLYNSKPFRKTENKKKPDSPHIEVTSSSETHNRVNKMSVDIKNRFYKSRRRNNIKNKTVRFAEKLVSYEKTTTTDNNDYVNNNNNDNNDSVNNNKSSWDITIDFEELV